MKAQSLIPPVLAMVVAGVWLGSQRRTIAVLEDESAVLKKHIAARTTGGDGVAASGKPDRPVKAGKERERIDWKEVAGNFAEMSSGGISDMRGMIRLQQRLLEMDTDELIAALDEIAGLELSEQARMMLEQAVLGPLVEKDPELALERYIGRVEENHGMMSWQLSEALAGWAKKDLTAATAWMDRQVAAGTFESKALDGKSRTRAHFESALLKLLISRDPAAAGQRLAAMPDELQKEALSQHRLHKLDEDDQLAFATLVRGQLAEKDHAGVLAGQAAHQVQGEGFEKVSDFLDRINASPAEREASVEKAAERKFQELAHREGVKREDFETVRTWAAAEAPGSVDRVTGKLLAQAVVQGREMPFAEAADLALEYHEAADNDDVLAEFLGSRAVRQDGNRERARELAGQISDEKRREEILKNLR